MAERTIRPVKDHNRRFLGQLLLVFGVLAVLGGYAAAFTEVGAVMVFAGTGMLVAALLVFLRVPVLVALAAGVAITVACTGMMAARLGG